MRRLLPVCALLLACNTLPVGYDELGRIPETRAFELAPESTASYGRYAALGNAEQLLLGQDRDFRARCLIQLSIPDTLTLDSVLSIQFILHPADTTRSDSFHFICRPCSTSWEEAATSWILAKTDEQWFNHGGDYWDLTVASGAALTDSLVVDLQYLALDSTMQRTIRDNGLFLFPASSADTGFLALWSSEADASLKPRTKVIYRQDSTTRYFDAAYDATLMDSMPGSTRAYEFLVGSGFVFRTWLRFNLDSIPREATVAGAELQFRPAVQYRRGDSLGLGIHRLTERYASRGNNPLFAGATVSAYYLPPADEDTVIRMDITSLVQFWTTNRDSTGRDTANFGLLVTPEPDWSPLFRLRIPSVGPDAPLLSIRYTLPPEGRF
jgi:hypothetical protein